MKYLEFLNVIAHNRLTKLIISVVFLFVFLTSHVSPLTSTAHAQEQTLKVSPVIINVVLSPDKISSQSVTIQNLSAQPMPLRATLSDFITGGEEGGYIFEETKTNPLLSWITLDEFEFILSPKEKKTIQMTILTPKSIPVGGYYGVLFFEPVAQGDQSRVTKINSKVGVLMLANVGVQDLNAKRAEILDFSTDELNTDGNPTFLLRVKNTALNFFSAKPNITIAPLIGWNTPKTEIGLEEKVIFPGNVRRWTEESKVRDLSPNLYKAQITVSTGNGQTVNAEQYFVVFPIAQAITLIVIVIVLVFLIMKRKRLGKAIKALIRP
jgi:hypothetical protein